MTIEDSSAPEAGYKSTFQVKPNAKCKFSTKETQQIIHDVLKEKLEGVAYNAETCSQLTKDISEDIKDRLKLKEWQRYKYVVNVTIGEMKGEGVRIGCRCVWDSETDSYAQEIFKNVKYVQP